jgi:creatinine amidohydrolase
METIRMEDMNWVDIKAAIDKGYKTVVVGIGSTEQHGPHLPTKTDAFIADYLSHNIAQKLGYTLMARTISVGCSDHHLSFSGTISLKKSTLKAVINDFISSLSRSGFKNILLLPTHGGNFETVQEVVEEFKHNFPYINVIAYSNLDEFIQKQIELSKDLKITPEESGVHAGEAETSEILAISEELVKNDRIVPGYIGKVGKKEVDLVFREGIEALTKNGVIGDPTNASVEHGKTYLEEMIEYLSDYFKKFL